MISTSLLFAMCKRRFSHLTIKMAKKEVKRLNKQYNDTFFWYKCKFCKNYHVGKNTEKRKTSVDLSD